MMPHLFVNLLSLFPEMFPGPLNFSLAGQALRKGIWSYKVTNIREFGITKHKKVDDTPYGGGSGLVMRPDVLSEAIDYAKRDAPANTKIYYMSPRGRLMSQSLIKDIIKEQSIIVLCGRFEGIDERLIEEYNLQEISLGNFVLSGGEVAAIALLDACIRLLPGVLVNQDTLLEESFNLVDSNGETLLEYPLYTKPQEWRGRKVPEVLLSGHHAKIQEWRLEKALEITATHKKN